MPFHAKDGWYFERLEDGVVAIRHECERHDNCASNVTVKVDANTWATIVASVSAEGDSSSTWARALQLHTGGPG